MNAAEAAAYTAGVLRARWAYEADPLALSRELAAKEVRSLRGRGVRGDVELAAKVRAEVSRW